ncbi:MAG TPA: 50S ribosomal protein L24 [Tenericutes bacterium]|jgi:large subunit ribosomal protein L24|nr:50S ribosomal protein L24 [Mycoplasmatota bacterium]
MKIKKGDKVIVIAGKDKGKEGTVLKVFRKENKVLVEGINKVKKHQKPSAQNETGKIVEIEKPIHVSNVMVIDPKTKKGTRIGYTTDKKGKKVRITKKSGTILD